MLYYCKISQDLKLLHVVILYRNKITFNTLLIPEPMYSQSMYWPYRTSSISPIFLCQVPNNPFPIFPKIQWSNISISNTYVIHSWLSAFRGKKKLICKSIAKLSWVKLKIVFLRHQASFTLPLPHALLI